MELEGTVVSGASEGAYFLGLPWVKDAIQRIVGFDPYLGTLNLSLERSALLRWREIRNGAAGLALTPPDAQACGGRLLPARVEGRVPAAVVIPDVTRYGDEVLEVIAPLHLRTHLDLRDGDRVRLEIERGRPRAVAEGARR